MTPDERTDQILDEMINEILSEERAALDGPACPDGTHTIRQRTLYRARGEELDPEWGTCTVCHRTVTRKGLPDWRVYHGSGCRCRECRR